MDVPILATKLYIPPPRPKIVLRPHLIERLNEGIHSKLTLISAPAGFGKTTLISEWVTEGKRPTAWLSLDEGDNDLTRFLVYFIAALRTIIPTIGEGVLGPLQSPQPPSMESILSTLINEISTIPTIFIFIFVFDDYHSIDSKPVDQALTFLIEHLPEQMRLVITTREDPDLPLARFRARDQLTEIRAADLQFTRAEAAEFLNQVMGLNLSIEDIAALETRTEGWIAGLQLAALSMQGRSDATSFIQTFTGSNRFVLDYLVEEVLRQQTEVVQTFLLRTSILEHMCGPLCEAVLCTPAGSGQEILEYLERANLFIIPLDKERRWYRYHHLFGDLLRHRLFQSSTLSTVNKNKEADERMDVQALNLRASEWYECNGSAADAIHHALAAKDFERAANLIEPVFTAMRHNQQSATLRSWIKALPEELIRLRPVLSTEYAFVSISGGELDKVEPRLQDAEHWLDSVADTRERLEAVAAGMVVVDEVEFAHLPGMIAIIRAALALLRGDMPMVKQNAQKAYDLAQAGDLLTLGGAASQMGLAAWANGDLDTARMRTAEGMENLQKGGYHSAVMGSAITLADIQIAQGCLNEAKATFERALRWATAADAPYNWGEADMHVGLSALYYEHNDLKSAMQHLQVNESLGELAGMPQNPYRWRAAMARLREAEGDLDGALDLLDKAERLYDGNFSPNIRPVASRKVRLWIKQGRLTEALGWVCAQGLSAEDELSYLREYDHITFARVLLALYQSDRTDHSIQELNGLLERLLKAAEERGGMGGVIEILILKAMAYHAQGNLAAALPSMQQALVLAEPQGYIRIFLDEGPSMMELLRETAARGIMPDYTGKLLAAAESEKMKCTDKPDLSSALLEGRRDSESLIEPLSQRELEVLKLLRSDLSGPEIALQLSVSINTFRTHTKNIFIKLGVNDRRAAIRRAEELDLF